MVRESKAATLFNSQFIILNSSPSKLEGVSLCDGGVCIVVYHKPTKVDHQNYLTSLGRLGRLRRLGIEGANSDSIH